VRVFVTGATGFIGRHLCAHLVEHGHQVIALLRTPAKASVLPEGCEIVQGDLSLFETDLELPECEVVVHLAGIVTAEAPEQYAAINRDAVGHLVACLQRQAWTPRRLVFASSLAAAGPSPTDRPWTEDDAPAPIDPYGEAKRDAEVLLRSAPFPTTSFRPPLVFGPEDPATLTLYASAAKGVGVRVAGPPQRLSWVDVRDAAAGIRLMVEDEREGHRTYFLGSPAPTDLAKLWRALGDALGRGVLVLPLPRWLLYVAMRIATAAASILGFHNQLDDKQFRQMVAPAFVCSSAALERDLGWSARHDLAACLAHAVAGYRAAGLL